MKFRYALLALFLAPLYAWAQQLPTFSSDAASTWYCVMFQVNSSVFEDCGAEANILNNAALEGNEAQQWKLVGSQDDFTLVAKSGRKLYYDKTANKCIASAQKSTQLRLVANNQGHWEIQIKNASEALSGDKVVIVMNGGSGVGHYLDVWTHNFAAAGIDFVLPEDMNYTHQPAPVTPQEVSITGKTTAPTQPLSLWYKQPGTVYMLHALPIGNGDLGAMLFGGVAQDRIQFNHKALWKGDANSLGSYLTFGDLYVINRNAKAATNYQRSLDINEAIGHVSYTSDGVDYEREYLASNPDGVIAIRYRASKDKALNMALQLINGQEGLRAKYTTKGAQFADQVANGMNFRAGIRVTHEGGTVTATKNEIEIKDAKEFTIYLTCDTDFDPLATNHLTGDAKAVETDVNTVLDNAVKKGFDAIKTDHVADYQALFNRVNFKLPQATNTMPTPNLLKATTPAAKAMVDILVFQYGRYLAIASSRGISVPSNLQGIWCKDGTPSGSAVWASDIHSNINVQMNYWPVEPTNLSELHMPFLEYIKNEATREGGSWQKNAQQLIGKNKGWVVNTAGNIFGGSSSYKAGKYSVANAWYCQHLWQHFTYTQDLDYLKNFALPLMKSTCEFWFERLVSAKNGDGTLECPNEYSPEQGLVQNATSHSQQLVYELFENMTKAIAILGDESGCDETFRTTLAEKMGKIDRGLHIDETSPNKKGMLREWKYQDYIPTQKAQTNSWADDEQNIWEEHRHPSHLMALYPGFHIDKGIDMDIYNAALKSLIDRGDKSTGWGRAFRLCLWARTRDAQKTYSTLRGFAHHTTAQSYDWLGGLYDNMLDAHATNTFQIEGNFGATAGIAEMLLQSRPDSLVILPALPKEWSEGNIEGLKAIGNFEVSMTWKEGKLSTLKITSLAGQPIHLAYAGLDEAKVTVEGGSEVEAVRNIKGRLAFTTTKGTTYVITPKGDTTGILQVNNDKDKINISVKDGRIIFPDHLDSIAVYDLQGHKVAYQDVLTTGIYIVKAGHLTRHVLVP